MREIKAESEVYLWLGSVDMRCGFDRLACLVQEHLNRSVLEGGIYAFLSRCRRRVKLLYWDKDGYALWYKRLEAGTLKVSKREGVTEISGVDLSELLSGVDLERIVFRKDIEKGLYK